MVHRRWLQLGGDQHQGAFTRHSNKQNEITLHHITAQHCAVYTTTEHRTLSINTHQSLVSRSKVHWNMHSLSEQVYENVVEMSDGRFVHGCRFRPCSTHARTYHFHTAVGLTSGCATLTTDGLMACVIVPGVERLNGRPDACHRMDA